MQNRNAQLLALAVGRFSIRCRLPPLVWFCVFQFAVFPFSYGQGAAESPSSKAPPIVQALQEPVHVPAAATLIDGTVIALRLVASVKVKEVKVGDNVPFVLYNDLYYRDVLLAKTGDTVEAEIIDAIKARWASRGSKLAIEIKGLKLLNGQTLPLRGYSMHKGGVGNTPRVADSTIKTGSEVICPMCGDLFTPAALVFFLAPGSNADVKENSSVAAFVDGDFRLDLPSFQPSQPKESSEKGTVQVVRGHYGWPYKRELYCNGTPLVHLNADHKFEINLNPGYYRFSIDPKKTPLQIYVAPGTNMKLIATHEEISEMRDQEVSLNSRDVWVKPFGKPKNVGNLLEKAKPVDQADIYSSSCTPLAEVFDLPASSDALPANSNPAATAEPVNSHLN